MLLFLPYAIVTPSTLASSALSAHAHLCAIDIGDVDRPRCRDAARTRDVGRQRVAADRRPARHGARPRVGQLCRIGPSLDRVSISDIKDLRQSRERCGDAMPPPARLAACGLHWVSASSNQDAKACEGGEMRGCENLGYNYLRGNGVSQDGRVAVKLFEKGCEARPKSPQYLRLSPSMRKRSVMGCRATPGGLGGFGLLRVGMGGSREQAVIVAHRPTDIEGKRGLW